MNHPQSEQSRIINDETFRTELFPDLLLLDEGKLYFFYLIGDNSNEALTTIFSHSPFTILASTTEAGRWLAHVGLISQKPRMAINYAQNTSNQTVPQKIGTLMRKRKLDFLYYQQDPLRPTFPNKTTQAITNRAP